MTCPGCKGPRAVNALPRSPVGIGSPPIGLALSTVQTRVMRV